MWFLWVFGDNVEDRLGHARYFAFYLLTGIGAGIVHTLFNWGSPIPAVGASGAISGVMGAYAVLFPGSRIVTLIPWFLIFMVRIPALVMIGYWFVLQFFSGVYSLSGPQSGGVAWWAHIGGFILGLALVLVLRKPKPPPVVYYVN
jgi:membrane associated rhomboid family serine protease